MSEARVSEAPAEAGRLAGRLAALTELVEVGEGRLPAGALGTARDALAKARERLAHGDAVVIAALWGGTGTGKSSLLNALAGGARIAPVGVRRPTTERPVAWIAGDAGEAGPLLDWLGVAERHVDPAAGADGAVLVVVDLPDLDSVARAHRATADRFIDRVDVLVCVVDPLKYAQRVVHDGYLRRLAAHAEVVLVVLNRCDELTAAERDEVAADLRRLLAQEGLADARVLTTSALTGEGVQPLRAALCGEARRRQAVAARLAADLRAAAGSLAAGVGARPVGPGLEPGGAVAALAGALGVPARCERAAADYREVARAASRSLLARLVAVVGVRARGLLAAARSMAFRAPGQVAPAGGGPVAVRSAVRRLLDAVAADLPGGWRERLRAAVDPESLTRAAGEALDRVDLTPPRRRWWSASALLLSLLETVTLVGFGWLAALGVLAWLQLPPPPTPEVAGALPLPTLLVLAGLAVRLAVAPLLRTAVRRGGRRHGARARARLLRALELAARECLVAPVRVELAAHDRIHGLLAGLGAVPGRPTAR